MAGKLFRDDSDNIISEINVIPLVDISLVLLIIFMVTANYIMTSSIQVDVPQATSAKAMPQQENLNIMVSKEGPVYLDGVLLTSKELKEKARSKYEHNPGLSVVLSADKNVNFKNVVSVLDVLSEIGITKLNIAATNE